MSECHNCLKILQVAADLAATWILAPAQRHSPRLRREPSARSCLTASGAGWSLRCYQQHSQQHSQLVTQWHAAGSAAAQDIHVRRTDRVAISSEQIQILEQVLMIQHCDVWDASSWFFTPWNVQVCPPRIAQQLPGLTFGHASHQEHAAILEEEQMQLALAISASEASSNVPQKSPTAASPPGPTADYGLHSNYACTSRCCGTWNRDL